jgi:hypothetical protein
MTDRGPKLAVIVRFFEAYARRAHLGAAGQAQRGVRGAGLAGPSISSVELYGAGKAAGRLDPGARLTWG